MRRQIVRFAAYRQYEETRISASNAKLALLAGAQLSSHLLQLMEGSERLLPEVFPRVPHIGRFNLSSEAARQILNSADRHLGAMSVPYALSLHEDHLKTCVGLLEQARLCRAGKASRTKLYELHAVIEGATGGTFTPDSMTQLDTLRLMRNCTIHEGGRANTVVVRKIASWSSSVDAAWTRLAGSSPRGIAVGDEVAFGHSEMILTLAVTKVLAREANLLLQPALPRQQWANMLVADLVSGDRRVLSAPDVMRRARGLSRFHYQPLGLTDAEIAVALTRH